MEVKSVRGIREVRAQSPSRVGLFCSPMDRSLPGFPVHEIFQARKLERVAISSSRGSFGPEDRTRNLLRVLHWQEDSLPLGKPSKSSGAYECSVPVPELTDPRPTTPSDSVR